MSYNFFLDNKHEENIIKPFSNNTNDSEQSKINSTSPNSEDSGDTIVDSENETKPEVNNSELKDNIENYNPNTQLQKSHNMDTTNVTPNREFFNNQASHGQQPNCADGNSQQNQTTHGDPNPPTNRNGNNHPQVSTQDQNKNNSDNHEDYTENKKETQDSEQIQQEYQHPETKDFEPENHPPFKSEVWAKFQQNLKDKDSFYRQKEYPRKPLMIDPDLYSTLREIDIDNIAPTNLLNVILRTFIESFKEELRHYRKVQAPSVF